MLGMPCGQLADFPLAVGVPAKCRALRNRRLKSSENLRPLTPHDCPCAKRTHRLVELVGDELPDLTDAACALLTACADLDDDGQAAVWDAFTEALRLEQLAVKVAKRRA
jgi:hypothetical protein